MSEKTLHGHVVDGSLTPADLLRAIARGGLREDKRYTLSTLTETLQPLLSVSGPQREIEFGSSDVYIVKINLPGSDLQYHTIMVGGQVVMTRGKDGDLSLAEPTTGISDLIDVLAHAAVFSGQAKATAKHKRPGGSKNPKKGGSKPHQTVLIDQALLDYFDTNATFLAFGYLDSSADTTQLTFKGPDQLEQIIDDTHFLKFASGKEVTVEAQTIAAHLARLRHKISRRVRVYHSELSENRLIRSAAIEVSKKYSGTIETIFPNLESLCSDVDIVQQLYSEFRKIKDRTCTENPVEHYLIGLREFALTILGEELGAGSNEHKNIVQSTAKWVAYAKAADYVSQDHYVATEIVPVLEDTDSEKSPVDKGFKAVCMAAERVVNPDFAYDPLFLRFVVRGMWMKGLLRNQEGGALGGDSANTEYTDGFGHYLTRRKIYAPLLDNAFERLNEAGEIREGLDLSKRLDCEKLGVQLYESLEDHDRNKFAVLTGPRTPLKQGSYLQRLLRWHVGLKREEYSTKMLQQEE